MEGWIGVDLDGCLAEYHGWPKDGGIGKPIPKMVERVKEWVNQGKLVKIFTARVCVREGVSGESGLVATEEFAESQRQRIKIWCRENIGPEFEVTNVKDFGMIELWDDRAIQVVPNTGIPAYQIVKKLQEELKEANEAVKHHRIARGLDL